MLLGAIGVENDGIIQRKFGNTNLEGCHLPYINSLSMIFFVTLLLILCYVQCLNKTQRSIGNPVNKLYLSMRCWQKVRFHFYEYLFLVIWLYLKATTDYRLFYKIFQSVSIQTNSIILLDYDFYNDERIVFYICDNETLIID